MPVREWAAILTVPSLAARLEPDALARQQTFGAEIIGRLAEHGKTGEHWRPQE